MDLLTDFGPDRANRWPNIDADHFTVHDVGADWAEVTEGNAAAWERERYAWDAAAGTVTVDTLDSNTWGLGSQWRYQLTPVPDGTEVSVTVDRTPKGLRGTVAGAVLTIAGGRILGRQFRSTLRQTEGH